MVERLVHAPPAAVVVVDRDVSEFGSGGFGFDYLKRFREAIARRMVPVERLGDWSRKGPLPFPAKASKGLLLVPRPGPAPL